MHLQIEDDDTLGSYGKSQDIYVYREGAGAGPHVGEIERGEWCTRRQSVLVCSGLLSVSKPEDLG